MVSWSAVLSAIYSKKPQAAVLSEPGASRGVAYQFIQPSNKFR